MVEAVKLQFFTDTHEDCPACGQAEKTRAYRQCEHCGHDEFLGRIGERILDLGGGHGEYTGVTACERCSTPFEWHIPVTIPKAITNDQAAGPPLPHTAR